MMNNIRKNVLYIINLIRHFLQSLWDILKKINIKIGFIDNSEIENSTIIKPVQTGQTKENQSETSNTIIKNKKKNDENIVQQTSSINEEKQPANINKLITIEKYNPYRILKTRNNLLKNSLFKNDLSDWYAKEIGAGTFKILRTSGYLTSGNNILMLSIPEYSNNSVAGVKQFIKLESEQQYEILITAKSDSTTAFPLLYLTINNIIYKLYCELSYKYFKITFKNYNKSPVKLTINTGYKLSKTPTNFYIDNVLLYEK